MNKKELEGLRELYPKGTRICLNHMDDPYRPVPSGTQGTVQFIDDAGTIQMSWDNGQGLGLVVGEDSFTVIERPEHGVEEIRVLIVEPNEPPRIANIMNTLEGIQDVVEGDAEEIDLDEDAVLICNELGKMNNLKANRRVGNDVIAGTFFIAREDGSEYLRSLTDEQIEKFQDRFQKLEDISQDELIVRSGFFIGGF